MKDREILKQLAETLVALSELVMKLADDEETAPQSKEYTADDIRAVMAKLLNAGKKDVVKSILQKYGVAKVSALTAENYSDVIADAEAEL